MCNRIKATPPTLQRDRGGKVICKSFILSVSWYIYLYTVILRLVEEENDDDEEEEAPCQRIIV